MNNEEEPRTNNKRKSTTKEVEKLKLEDDDIESPSVDDASTQPPSPPQAPNSHSKDTDEDTVDLYRNDGNISPHSDTDVSSLSSDGGGNLSNATKERFSPKALAGVNDFSEDEDNLTDTGSEFYDSAQEELNSGAICRQWYIDNAENFNQYLQEEDIEVLNYLVKETEQNMDWQAKLMWEKITDTLCQLDNLHKDEENINTETKKECLKNFNRAIRLKRAEYKVSSGKQTATTLMSEEEIQARIKQREQAEEQRQLGVFKDLFEPGEEKELFDRVVSENQEDNALTEQGWNRIKQIFELKRTAENWSDIRDKLIKQNLSESAWQEVDDFFIKLERLKDQDLESEIQSLLNESTEVLQIFQKLLQANEGQQEFLRQELRDDILGFCQYVNQHPEKWGELKQKLLQAETPQEIEQNISDTLSAAAQEQTAKEIQENSERIYQAYMQPIQRTSSEIILTGIYKLHRETLVKNLDENSIAMLDTVLTHPAIGTPIFKHFWEGTNSYLRSYLAAEYNQGDNRDISIIAKTKQELEKHISESYSPATNRLPEHEPNQEVANLDVRPMTIQLLAFYINGRFAIQDKIHTEYFDAIIAKIIEDGNDNFISEDQVDRINNEFMKIVSLNPNNVEKMEAIKRNSFYIYKEIFILQGPAALKAVKDLNKYINRVSSEKYVTGNDFYIFKDSRAKSRKMNCRLAEILKEQILDDPKNISAILSESNINKIKRQTGAKVTNSKELNQAITSAQQAINQEDTIQQQNQRKI